MASDLFGNTALRRPDSLRTHAEDLFVQIEAALQLFARIFGMAIAVLRQRQPGEETAPICVSHTSGRMGW